MPEEFLSKHFGKKHFKGSLDFDSGAKMNQALVSNSKTHVKKQNLFTFLDKKLPN